MMSCALIEIAATSVLGALDARERALLDRHLAQGCPDCERELVQASELVADLAEATPVPPPASLRDRVLASVAANDNTPGLLLDTGGVLIKRSDELTWLPFLPGIERKLLHTDPERRYRSFLLRLEPGARLYKHHHPDVEEILLLSGDINVSGIEMRVGDYCRASADSIHEESFSINGCVMFVSASMDIRPVA
jgi:anti-sigma factor ChrR (cupin superfamily)